MKNNMDSKIEFSLRLANVSDGTDIYQMLQRIGSCENRFNNEVNGMTFEQFKVWLKERVAWSEGMMLPPGYVRQWTYWLYNGDIPVGFGKLREKVTDQSRIFGGNIGFAIDPLYRRHGFGCVLLEMLISEGRRKQLSELFSTVEKYNYASKRIHEKCGGILVKEDDVRWYYCFSSGE